MNDHAEARTSNRPLASGGPRVGRRGLLASLSVVLVASAIVVLAQSGHRAPPAPMGAVCRLEAREVVTPWDRFEVYPDRRASPAFAVFAAETNEFAASFMVYAYPDGRVLESRTGSDAVQARDAARERAEDAPPMLDLDGDGREDGLVNGTGLDRTLVRITNAARGRVLFEDRDELEYETNERVIPLGDLDGDGHGECAVLHPRMNRSKYDLEPWDALLGARSWICIVSGSRLEG